MEDGSADFEQYEIELALRESDRGKALERIEKKNDMDLKEKVQRGKDIAAERMANMGSLAMDALEMGLQSEDEGIRMKALAMWMDRNTNRQGVVREQEVIEVVDEVKKMTLEEIEIILKKKGLVDEGSN